MNRKCRLHYVKPSIERKNPTVEKKIPAPLQSIFATSRHLVIFYLVSYSLYFNEVAQQAQRRQLPGFGWQTTGAAEEERKARKGPHSG